MIERRGKTVRLGRLFVTADRWFERQTGWCRFGGGWKWKLGVDIGGKTVIVNLIWGLVRFSTVPPRAFKELLP